MGPYRVESAKTHIESARTQVELSRLGSKSNQVSPGSSLAKSSRSKSNRVDLNPYRVKLTLVEIEIDLI